MPYPQGASQLEAIGMPPAMAARLAASGLIPPPPQTEDTDDDA